MRSTLYALAALMVASAGFAQDLDKQADELVSVQFGIFDANRDGKLTLKEMQSRARTPEEADRAAEKFKLMDANQDGYVTKQELKAFLLGNVLRPTSK